METLKERLEDLRFKIRGNTATVEDYKEYEKIINDYGLIDELSSVLKRYGYTSWHEYIDQRKNAKTFRERNVVNGDMLGLILGVSSALLLLWALGKNDKPIKVNEPNTVT